jgi:sialidase-1
MYGADGLSGKRALMTALLFFWGALAGAARSEVEHRELFSAGLADVCEYRIPSLICTPTGTLVAVVDARKDRKGDIPNNVDLAMRRSVDGGETWEPVRIIVDYGKPEGYEVSWGAADVAMVFDQETSTLWCLYTLGQGVGIRQSKSGLDGHTCQIHAIYSKDEGQTWSGPKNITPDCKAPDMKFFGTAPGRGIQTRDGSLVFCIYSTEEGGNTMTASLIVSEDHGQSWKRTSSWADGITSVTETQVVELPDGTWMVNSRNHYGKQRRLVASTTDKGETWSEISFDEALPCPTCMASLVAIPHPTDKDQQLLVFANPASEKGRKNGTVRVSDDHGKTWKWSKKIVPGAYGYSCLAQLKDGNIGLFYEGGKGKLFFVKLAIEDLMDKKFEQE